MKRVSQAKYTVLPLTEDMYEGYEAFLLCSNYTLLYASLVYKKFLENLLACKSAYFIALDAMDRIVGALPLMISQSAAYGAIANSLPFYGSNGGVVLAEGVNEIEGRNIRQILLEVSEDYIKEKGCAASTVITSPFEGDNAWYEQHYKYEFLDYRIGQVTPLPLLTDDLSEQLMMMFNDPRPRNIRKAMKSGINWYVSHKEDDLEFLCKVHHQNIAAVNGIPKDDRFFSLIPSFFGKRDYRIYIAENEGVRVAALLLFYFNKTVEYYTPAIVEEYRAIQPMSLLIFEAMKHAVQNGYQYWNWGGTWATQKGVYDFKRRWGTREYKYFYYTKIYNKNILKGSREILLSEYPYFYVLPFKELSN
jgi:hypothetical protein